MDNNNRIIEQIEKIKQIKRGENLVIFVGAGVSKNSGVCSWWELVKEISDKVGENKCTTCEVRNLICGECGEQIEMCTIDNYNCKLKYDFSAEDYLRIPQHFYESFGTNEGEKAPYYEFLKGKFDKEYIPNIIDDIIIQLQPEHIITTNYDHLLENVKDSGVAKYAIITNDDSMLAKKGRHYIIKMHGDVDDINNIVLREDDYLNYSQRHIIIETFIKALLIDKTFLFVGYSLNDNNLKLIMSYIDFFVKEKKITNRQPHYLVVEKIEDTKHDIIYWENKGVELVDLSQISEYMVNNSKCDEINDQTGKRLYSFLYYLKNEGLAYTDDKIQNLNDSMRKYYEGISCFKYISYKTITDIFSFKSTYGLKTPILMFGNSDEYNNFKILLRNEKIRSLLLRAGIYGIQLSALRENDHVYFDDNGQTNNDILFELSINNKYQEIMEIIEGYESSSEKVYYYSLVKYIDGLMDITSELQKKFEDIDYKYLSNEDCYDLAIYEFNKTCALSLVYRRNNDYDKLNSILDVAAARYTNVYYTIKNISNKESDIYEMNNKLLKHEEYYMKKSTISKLGGTVYGDLFEIRQIAYDYYLFYKKNHLMLDWFSDVEKVVQPYIKAIFCTYYPDEFQGNNRAIFPRTQVKPYAIELIDLDMIVKHAKLGDLRRIASYYKVSFVEISEEFDISEVFENFCISMKLYWNNRMAEQLDSFCYILSICNLKLKQNERIVSAFVTLFESTENIRILSDSINSLSLYVKAQFDNRIEEYKTLFNILVNKEIIQIPTSNGNAYSELIKTLAGLADEDIYIKSCRELEKMCNNGRQRTYWAYLYRSILLKYNEKKWKRFIKDNINNNWENEVFVLLYERIIHFDNVIKAYYEEKIKNYISSEVEGISSFPDHKTDTINSLVLMVLLNIINLNEIDFLREYKGMSDYLAFMFDPEIFDYGKISLSDTMWCNILNNDYYREIILKHKNDFWDEKEEERIKLGFGTSFENRIAYKYLFD